MKYVMIDKRFPVLFPDFLSHISFVAAAKIERRKITSAGFVSVIPTMTCYGESVSLKLKPAKNDMLFIEMLLAGTHQTMAFLVEVD